MLHSFWVSSAKITSKSSFRNKWGNAVMSGVEDEVVKQCWHCSALSFPALEIHKNTIFLWSFQGHGRYQNMLCEFRKNHANPDCRTDWGLLRASYTDLWRAKCSPLLPDLSKLVQEKRASTNPRICRIHGDIHIFKNSWVLGLRQARKGLHLGTTVLQLLHTWYWKYIYSLDH